jgi:hypothetical protein
MSEFNSLPARVKWTPCTPDFAHFISGLESVSCRNNKTTWYKHMKQTGKRLPISFRKFDQESRSYNQAGYNKDYWNQTPSLRDRFDQLCEYYDMTPDSNYKENN